jgi:Protein of unknown function (DUF2795)
MTHGGDKVGPLRDDYLKQETRGEVQGGHANRTEEWREPEPPGEDQPDATWAPEGGRGGVPPGETPEGIEVRSELARHLDRATFPTDRAGLLAHLSGHNAPDRLLDEVSRLPADARFSALADVLAALGLPPRETRRT